MTILQPSAAVIAAPSRPSASAAACRRHALLDTGAEPEPPLKPPTASAACATELQIIAGLEPTRLSGTPAHICTGVGPPLSTSAPGLGSPLPHLHRDWAHRRSRGRSGIAQCGAWLQHKRRRLPSCGASNTYRVGHPPRKLSRLTRRVVREIVLRDRAELALFTASLLAWLPIRFEAHAVVHCTWNAVNAWTCKAVAALYPVYSRIVTQVVCDSDTRRGASRPSECCMLFGSAQATNGSPTYAV